MAANVRHDRQKLNRRQRVNLPNPAIVTERNAQRLPRLALLLFCAAYVLPGLFGRDPWRNADLTAFGFMASIAQGHAGWLQPAIAGIPAEGGLLSYWIGAIAIKALPFLEPALAARLPFGVALTCVLILVWYSSFHLARTEAAQPVAFAFGGEAQGIDYARAIADGALLALIASLGLLQLGHETTPELIQLLACSMFVYGLAAAPYRAGKAKLAVMVALPMLAASGAPVVALVFGAGGILLCSRSSYDQVRNFVPWLLAAGLASLALAWGLHVWEWRVKLNSHVEDPLRFAGLLAWFCWPAWPLALWTLWRWRRHWQHRHVSVPLLGLSVPLATSALMNGSDRALLLSLPALAVLASFALPTLKRSVAAAMDWFAVFFFSLLALFVWVYYASMQAGWPSQPLANVRKLAQGYEPSFHPLAFGLALLASLAWLALVRWRTAKHQHALWKSLVLPAGGVALLWLLMMSLWLPLLDYARSNRPLVDRLRAQLPLQIDCLAAPQQALPLLAALEFQGGWRVDAKQTIQQTRCSYAVQLAEQDAAPAVPEGWSLVASVRRPTDRQQRYLLLQRR